MMEAELGSTTTLAGMGLFQTELAANQVPLKLAPLAALTATVVLWVAAVVPLAPLQVRVNVVVALSAPVLALPLVGSLPDHPPEAAQLVAFVDDQLNVEADPLLTVPGVAVRLTVGLTGAETLTVTDCVALPPAPLQVSVKVVAVLNTPVLALPLVGSLPDQPPDAVQLLAFVEDQLSIDEPPLVTVVGLAL